MSASDKKKLRKETSAGTLTEKQKKQLAEDKKLKAATISFVAIMLAIVLVAATVLGIRFYKTAGFVDKMTTAAVTSTGHKLDTVTMNYYFVDYVDNMYQQVKQSFGENASMYISTYLGIDPNAPLNTQKLAENSDKTQADYYLSAAMDKAKNDYVLYDLAKANGFQLPEDYKKDLETSKQMLEYYAIIGGFKSPKQYLKAKYGNGASVKSYNEYVEITTIAAAYYNAYSDSIAITNDQIREYEKDKYNEYSNFSYAIYQVKVSDYLEGGTENKDGSKNFSAEEKAKAQTDAKADMETLKTATSYDDFEKKISALKINTDNAAPITSTKYDNVKYAELDLPENELKWLTNSERKDGNITVVNNETTTKDESGKDVVTVESYTIICFMSRNDNKQPMSNVRHLLVEFEGGKTDEKGNTTYSEAEKQAAKAEAERLLGVWKSGPATEESFTALLKEHSDDRNPETNEVNNDGLYKDVNPDSAYVESFLAWSVDPARKKGDTGVIVTEYGYHVMYFSGHSETTYRDHMITEALRSAKLDEWYKNVTASATITPANTKRVKLDLALATLG